MKVILLTSLTGRSLERVIRSFGASAQCMVVSSLPELLDVAIEPDTALVSFGTSVIVPGAFLRQLKRPAYNIHAASPDFPGRDPHHFAIYRRANTYGATLHIMTEKVDAGPIVGVELFDVRPDATPKSLLVDANEAAIRLVERFGLSLVNGQPLPELHDQKWGSEKTKRTDLQRLGEVSVLMSAEEFERRVQALEMDLHANLSVSLHGRTFRIDPTASRSNSNDAVFAQFTEAGYVGLLRKLKFAGYQFSRFGEPTSGRHVLWRHDVDVSMHRAVHLAEIEHQHGVSATYFLNPRSSFYNLFEPELEDMAKRIRSLGHEVGLHFDASAYRTVDWTSPGLEAAVSRERLLLETLLQSRVSTVSWHNPDQSNLLEFQDEQIAGLVSAYSGRLRRDYVYCSDSNGYWRFKNMEAVIDEGHNSLHLLTHPDWWTPSALSPSERIDRAILGRARRIRGAYDARLSAARRINVTQHTRK